MALGRHLRTYTIKGGDGRVGRVGGKSSNILSKTPVHAGERSGYLRPFERKLDKSWDGRWW